MLETRIGNQLTCTSTQAAKLYQNGIDLILGSESGAAETLDQALEIDNQFTLAAAARYFVAKDSKDPKANDYKTIALASCEKATEWEREHVSILFGLIEEAGKTVEKAQAYVKKNPGDLLIISQLAGYLFFYGGPQKLNAVLSLFESVEHKLGNDWAYLVRLGFAASESGDRVRGRKLIERSLEIRPQSLYTIHALAHVLHDDGAATESAQLLTDWLAKHESTARKGQMYGHVQWHLALAEWQLGKRELGLKRYQDFCAPSTTTCGPVLTLADCGGFLLRDYLTTGKTTPLPKDVLNHIENFWGMIAHPFIALHLAGLFASAGDLEGIKKCMDKISAAPPSTNQNLSQNLVSAIKDFVSGNQSQASQTLATISTEARIGIGGSKVERELVDILEKSCS